jgi:hypothetical protein
VEHRFIREGDEDNRSTMQIEHRAREIEHTTSLNLASSDQAQQSGYEYVAQPQHRNTNDQG